MPAIPKPLSEIAAEDLTKLIIDGWAEDEHLEFKETLPSKGAARDPWLVDQSEVGTGAKRDVLAEVIGMANSYGGDVILGLKESEALPHRAEALTPLPKCMDLARRFEMFARDHIRPEIPLLAVRGIPTDDDSGVIVLRVPNSALAPHRLEIKGIEKECYKRTRDRTEAMSMREIQDLTLERERGVARLNQRLDELRARYEEFCQHPQLIPAGRSAISYTIRAAPVGPQSGVTRVHGVRDLTPERDDPHVTLAGGREYRCIEPHRMPQWRPMLRGTRASASEGRNWNLIELSTDGAYLRSVLHRTDDAPDRRGFFVGWLLAAAISACDTVDRFRRHSGSESVEYALELEVTAIGEPHRIALLGAQHFADSPDSAVLTGGLKLPRYSLGPVEERAALLNVIYEDFWAYFGIDAVRDRIVAFLL